MKRFLGQIVKGRIPARFWVQYAQQISAEEWNRIFRERGASAKKIMAGRRHHPIRKPCSSIPESKTAGEDATSKKKPGCSCWEKPGWVNAACSHPAVLAEPPTLERDVTVHKPHSVD